MLYGLGSSSASLALNYSGKCLQRTSFIVLSVEGFKRSVEYVFQINHSPSLLNRVSECFGTDVVGCFTPLFLLGTALIHLGTRLSHRDIVVVEKGFGRVDLRRKRRIAVEEALKTRNWRAFH